MGRLDNKVAVITGGASGIGEATARLFAEEGASVVIADIQDESGATLSAEIGPAAVYQHTDVTREADVKAAVECAQRSFGGLDIMYNNAGGILARGSITEISTEDFDAAIALLLRSVFLGMKHSGTVLAAQGHGVIISTASIAGMTAGAGPHIYSTAKAAVIQLTKSVALELGEKGVRVNCICPGGVTTPLVLNVLGLDAEAMPALAETMSATQPIARAGSPLDIARAALWLASDEADYITGQHFAVDGGEATGPSWSKQALT